MYRTLCIVVLFAFSALTVNAGDVDIGAGMEECRKQYGVSDDFTISLANLEPLMEDPKTRCFTACFLEVIEIFDQDGSLKLDRLIELVPGNVPDSDQIIQGLRTCANEKGADKCETAYKIYKCIPQ